MANSPSVRGVLGFLMSPICIRLETVWAGTLRWIRKLDSKFMSPLHRNSIHSRTGVITRCGCFHVRVKIQTMILWWKSMVLRHCIPLWRDWCMLSGEKMKKVNRMWHTRWFRLQRHGRSGGSQKRKAPINNHLSRYQRTVHTSLISSDLKKRNQIWRPWWRDTLCGVLLEHGVFIDGG